MYHTVTVEEIKSDVEAKVVEPPQVPSRMALPNEKRIRSPKNQRYVYAGMIAAVIFIQFIFQSNYVKAFFAKWITNPLYLKIAIWGAFLAVVVGLFFVSTRF